jgi:hypothetical protein
LDTEAISMFSFGGVVFRTLAWTTPKLRKTFEFRKKSTACKCARPRWGIRASHPPNLRALAATLRGFIREITAATSWL